MRIEFTKWIPSLLIASGFISIYIFAQSSPSTVASQAPECHYQGEDESEPDFRVKRVNCAACHLNFKKNPFGKGLPNPHQAPRQPKPLPLNPHKNLKDLNRAKCVLCHKANDKQAVGIRLSSFLEAAQ